jgi:hypothetical protein
MEIAALRRIGFWLSLMFAVALCGCTVKWVADYDQASADKIGAAYERVDRMYERLAAAPAAERTYDKFADDWSGIATDLRGIALRQKSRTTNDESAEILDRMVASWETSRAKHKQRSEADSANANAYPDSLISLDRQQLEAEFVAALSAERFKN